MQPARLDAPGELHSTGFTPGAEHGVRRKEKKGEEEKKKKKKEKKKRKSCPRAKRLGREVVNLKNHKANAASETRLARPSRT